MAGVRLLAQSFGTVDLDSFQGFASSRQHKTIRAAHGYAAG
jgi:hypothetical protein